MKQKVKCSMCKKDLEREAVWPIIWSICETCALKDICAKIVKEYEEAKIKLSYVEARECVEIEELGIAINDLEMFLEGLE